MVAHRPGKGRRDYDEAHLPGAISWTWTATSSLCRALAVIPSPSPAEFVARMERIGIGDDSEVVAYDDAGGTIAARLWWMLDCIRPDISAHVLDGGLAAWTWIEQP